MAQELVDTLSLPTDGPVNRMQSCVRTLRARKDLHIGDLGIKNIMEACAAQCLVHFTTEELRHLPNGSGSRDFWILTKLDRATTTTTARGLVERITQIDVRYPGGDLKFMPADLHFVPTNLDERWMQYWACAQ